MQWAGSWHMPDPATEGSDLCELIMSHTSVYTTQKNHRGMAFLKRTAELVHTVFVRLARPCPANAELKRPTAAIDELLAIVL